MTTLIQKEGSLQPLKPEKLSQRYLKVRIYCLCAKKSKYINFIKKVAKNHLINFLTVI